MTEKIVEIKNAIEEIKKALADKNVIAVKVSSFHGGWNEIKNTRTEIIFSKRTNMCHKYFIDKPLSFEEGFKIISKRKGIQNLEIIYPRGY